MTLFSRLRRPRFNNGDIQTIELLSRPGCHLCDDAMGVLRRELAHVQIDVVDITRHSDLEEEFVFRIPVVRYLNHVLAEGIIGRPEARRVKQELERRARMNKEAT